MVAVHVNTYAAFAQRVREIENLPATIPDDLVMSWRYHAILKNPPDDIREVRRSSRLLRGSPEMLAALDELERDALQGNLKKYVSKQANRLGGRHDGLLYRSAIWHFHILPEPGRAQHTSRHLVFAYIWKKVLYLLEYGAHADREFQRDPYYLEALSQEWPTVLPSTDIDVEGIPLGGGVAVSGESRLMLDLYEEVKRFANYADLILNGSTSMWEEFVTTFGYPCQPIYLDFLDFDRSLKPGHYPSFAFYYRIRGTNFYVKSDLRNGKNDTAIISRDECLAAIAEIDKG